MNGDTIKKAAINRAKQVANAANGNGGKKRRKGGDLKPIITTENQQAQDAGMSTPSANGYVHTLSTMVVDGSPQLGFVLGTWS
jgi:serine/threonine-protein kinase SRPK3